MKRSLKYLVLLLLCYAYADGQEEQLIIGRTTGEISLKDSSYTVFGFTNTLSGQVTLPGTTIQAIEGDTVLVDFWNISQGEPHALFVDSLELRTSGKITSGENIEEVHHMDHAFYELVADKPGYYLYYCPFNFPFNVQAGMFGLVQVQSTTDSTATTDIVLCSHELDTTWHREAIMDIDAEGIAVLMESYKPQHFLVNGRSISAFTHEPLSKNQKVKFHVLNAGQYQHEIKIINGLQPQEKEHFVQSDINEIIILAPMSSNSMELIVSDENEISLQYEFRNIKTDSIEHSEILHLTNSL